MNPPNEACANFGSKSKSVTQASVKYSKNNWDTISTRSHILNFTNELICIGVKFRDIYFGTNLQGLNKFAPIGIHLFFWDQFSSMHWYVFFFYPLSFGSLSVFGDQKCEKFSPCRRHGQCLEFRSLILLWASIKRSPQAKILLNSTVSCTLKLCSNKTHTSVMDILIIFQNSIYILEPA